jgi:hypothetical protein
MATPNDPFETIRGFLLSRDEEVLEAVSIHTRDIVNKYGHRNILLPVFSFFVATVQSEQHALLRTLSPADETYAAKTQVLDELLAALAVFADRGLGMPLSEVQERLFGPPEG